MAPANPHRPARPRWRSVAACCVALFGLTFALHYAWSWVATPRNLARQIAEADRAMVEDGPRRMVLTGTEVRRLVQAVSSARRDRNNYPAIFSTTIEFYRGTNFLSHIQFQDRLFWAGREQYSEGTGFLRDLNQRFWEINKFQQ